MAARGTPIGLGEVEHAPVLDRMHGRANGAPCQAETVAVRELTGKDGEGRYNWYRKDLRVKPCCSDDVKYLSQSMMSKKSRFR